MGRLRDAWHALRGYAAAQDTRASSWAASGSSATAEVGAAAPTVARRARDAVRNDPYAARIVDLWTGNAVGAGITTRWPDKPHAEAWRRWSDSTACDAEGRLDLYGLQALVMRAVVESGECFVRLLPADITPANPIGLRLQVLESDHLDAARQGVIEGVPTLQGNIVAWRLDGISATLANYEVGSDGAPRLGTASGVTIPTTAPAGWSVLELEPNSDECYFHGRALDGTGLRANSYARQQQLPDPAALYRFRVRVRNRQVFHGISAVANNGSSAVRITRAAHGYATSDSVTVANVAGVPGANGTFTITVIDANNFDLVGSTLTGAYVNTGWATISRNLAPASNTDLRLQFVSISDYAELTTAITAGRANAVAGQGIGVNVLTAAAPALSVVGGQARNTAGAVPVLAATGYAANPVAVTTARGVDLLATLIGAIVTKPYAIPEADWTYAGPLAGIATGSDTAVQAAGGAGIRRYVTGMQVQNASATATEFQIRDGTTPVWRALLPANLGPTNIDFPTPLRTTANAALNIQAVTASAVVIANLQGFTAP